MRAYLFVLIYAGMLPLALLSPFAGAMIWAWLSLMYPQSQTYGYFSFGFAAPVAALTLAAFLLSRERALPPSTAVAWSMAGMILACGVAHATAIDREIGAVRWDTIWKGLLLALATLAMLRTQLRIHALVWIVALSIGYFGLKGGLFTLLTGGRYRVVGADGSIIGDNNHLAVALAMVLPPGTVLSPDAAEAARAVQRLLERGEAYCAFTALGAADGFTLEGLPAGREVAPGTRVTVRLPVPSPDQVRLQVRGEARLLGDGRTVEATGPGAFTVEAWAEAPGLWGGSAWRPWLVPSPVRVAADAKAPPASAGEVR